MTYLLTVGGVDLDVLMCKYWHIFVVILAFHASYRLDKEGLSERSLPDTVRTPAHTTSGSESYRW